MEKLWNDLQGNLAFVIVCICIIAALALGSRLSEHFLKSKRLVSTAKRVSIVGLCSAIAAVLHILDFPLIFLAPEFYKLDFSELPVLLCGFYLGPSSAKDPQRRAGCAADRHRYSEHFRFCLQRHLSAAEVRPALRYAPSDHYFHGHQDPRRCRRYYHICAVLRCTAEHCQRRIGFHTDTTALQTG